MPDRTLTVATANTNEGRLLESPTGLESLHKASVDVLLLQEVIDIDADKAPGPQYPGRVFTYDGREQVVKTGIPSKVNF